MYVCACVCGTRACEGNEECGCAIHEKEDHDDDDVAVTVVAIAVAGIVVK
jgi:hypothetical protein